MINVTDSKYCATCGYHKDSHGNIAVTDCPTFVADTRPKPGKLAPVQAVRPGRGERHPSEKDGFPIDEGYELARSGDAGGAILSGLIKRREEAASALHYRLVEMRDDFDRGARVLEDGNRRHVLSRTNWYAELPIMLEAVADAQQAVEDAELLFEYSRRATPEIAAFRLDQAAETVEAIDVARHDARAKLLAESGVTGELSPLTPLPLVLTLRAEAEITRRNHENRLQREADERNAKSNAEKAKRIARPLGANEKKVLADIQKRGPQSLPYRHMSNDGKAYASLIERGLIAPTKDAETAPTYGQSKGPYELTDAGKERVA